MWEKEREELLQDYRYRRNILQEITLDDIDRWNNMEADVDWDKITNKPTTLEGYGITDCYTKDEIQDNTLNKFKAINGKVLVDTGFNLGLKDGDNLISYNYGTSGAPTLKLGVNAYISSYMSNMDIVATTQLMLKTDNLNLKTKLFNLQGNYGSFSVDVSDNKGNNKLYASIPAEFANIVKAPRINIYSGNNTVLEGALWNSTYNINGTIKDGLHLSHENGKYLALAYKNASTGIYNSYMIFDVEGVLKNDSDGDDWGPVRFEQNVFFRHGLKIGGGEDITLAGKGVNTRITALENAISQGTGMVEWNNVLNKPSTFTPSIHSHAISDITSLQSALDGKAASNHNHDSSYLKLSGGAMDPNAELTFANAKGIYGKDSKGGVQRLIVVGADDSGYFGATTNHTYIRSKDCPQYLDAVGNKYNFYHSGNFTPSDYFSRSGQKTANLNTCYDVGLYYYTNSTTGAPNKQYGHLLNTVSSGNKYNGSTNWLSQLAFNTDDTVWHRSKVNSGGWTNWTKLVKTTDLNNYLPKSGGNVSGNIILNNTIKISSKDKGGTVRDLIWMNNATNGEVVVGGGTNQVTFDIPSPNSLKIWCDGTQKSYEVYHTGNFTPGNYMPWTYKNEKTTTAITNFRKLIRGTTDKGGFLQSFRKNDTTDWCMPQYGSGVAWGQDDTHGMIYTSYNEAKAYVAGGNGNVLRWARQLAFTDDLKSYLPLSGGTITGELALTQDKGIISANAEGGTLLVETSTSVSVGKTTKNLNLNCSLAYMNGARVLTEYNYASYVLPKTIFAGLFSPDKTIGTDSNTFYGYSKKTVYKSADCTVGTERITISKAGTYKVTATWGGVPKSGTANTSAMRFIIQQRNSSAAIASKLNTITVTTLNRTAKSTISGLFKCSANDYFIFFSYLCTVTFESEDVEIEIVRIS